MFDKELRNVNVHTVLAHNTTDLPAVPVHCNWLMRCGHI